MTCRNVALLRLVGAWLVEGGCFPRGSPGLGSSGFFIAAPETGDERDLLFVTRGRRARAGTRLGAGF